MSKNSSGPLTEEALKATTEACRKWDRLCAAAPALLELVRETNPEQSHQHTGMRCWFCKARELLKRIDGK